MRALCLYLIKRTLYKVVPSKEKLAEEVVLQFIMPALRIKPGNSLYRELVRQRQASWY